MPPSSLAPMVSTAQAGNFSATTYSMPLIILKMPATSKKGELRQNQFGVSIGGPVIKNKVFFFGDYEGLRRLPGNHLTGSVPTLAERRRERITPTFGSDHGTNWNADRHLGPNNADRDDSGSCDDAASGVADPISGLTAILRVRARSPAHAARDHYVYSCWLRPEQLPAGRLDPNAIKLLNLVSPADQRRHFSPISLIRRPSAKIATLSTPGWISTSATRTRFSTDSAMWTIRNLFPAFSGA